MAEYEGLTRRQFMYVGSVSAATLALGLAGCSFPNKPADDNGTPAGNDTAPEPEATEQTVVDLQGDSVVVPTKVTKVADLWHAHNQVMIMLGAGGTLVGTTDVFKKRAWVNVVYPRISEVEALVIGSGAGEVNYEECMALEPDVVFGSDKEVIATARSKGLAALNVGFQDYDGLRKDVQVTAQVLGGEALERAKTWEEMLDANIALVQERMAKSTKPKTRVLHICNANDFNMVDGPNTIVDEWIKLAGGENALTQEGNRITLTTEEILASNPEVVIIGSATPEDVERFKADPNWQGVTAVKNGAVSANPDGMFPWDRYSGEEALQVLWAAKFFNPELFADIDMEQETKDFYELFYGYKLTDDQVKRILSGAKPA